MINNKKYLGLSVVLIASTLLLLGCGGGGSSAQAKLLLSIESVVYDDNNTVTVDDDSLSIYFNRTFNINATKEEISNNFDIDGTGSLGDSVSVEYSDTSFSKLRVMLDANSTKFAAGETKISFANANRWEDSYRVDKTPVTITPSLKVMAIGQGVYSEVNGTVKDDGTGLVWQKEDDGNQRNWSDAKAYCEALTLNGLNWELPTIDALMTLTDKSVNNPAIDPIFTNTKNSHYWTQSEYLGSPADDAWTIDFANANTSDPDKTTTYYARCVSSAEITTSSSYIRDNINEVVLDTSTNLMWDDTANTIGSENNQTFDDAITLCENSELAGHADWRVPNINELDTITDKSTYGPAMSSEFEYRSSSVFWSKTEENSDNSKAWYTYFWCGCNDFKDKGLKSQVRCVRSAD